ncbi:hypothetical protein [Paenibacillus wynnii]|uniref:Nuclease SbcCD subunit C n=1 Tax=Paenibacillus wynnii TaxID=268407 RepID=A0A098M3V8_9BACL|nr:hypothetical protein [Paenibacillus wynnii]KGE17224.1 hypothetical protein PWYN_21590 [Paenibacillus wynnii]
MGRLKVTRVHYMGDKYTYSSLPLEDGINIIEAGNGGGKTTFSGLICFALGDYVQKFDFTKTEVHFEVKNDNNNFVLLEIEINDIPYKIKRYFGKNQNVVLIQNQNGREDSFFLNRQGLPKGQITYSDWLLDKIGIEVVDVWQGATSFKINFTDLFRLIHYDQGTEPKKIYKEHRNENNFISDSGQIRKVIFELLVGHRFSDFYVMLGKLRELEKQRDAQKILVTNFGSLAVEMGYDVGTITSSEILRKVTEDKLELQRIQLLRNEVKNRKLEPSSFEFLVSQIRTELVESERELSSIQMKMNNVSFEKRDLIELKEELIREVSHINKILFSHNMLHLFSPDVCPCCFKKVERVSGHCICGAEIDEGQYERYFYNSQEYLEILRAKQKSIETIELGIQSCGKEVLFLSRSLESLVEHQNGLREQLSEAEGHTNANDQELLQLNERVYQLKSAIQENENKAKMIEKYEEVDKKYNKAKSDYSTQLNNVRITQLEIDKLIQSQINTFNATYNHLMTTTVDGVTKSEINEYYMPVLNEGYYKEASSNVPKRFLYFLTLLSMSLSKNSIPFPKFLLVDTPENLGIDKENLDSCLQRILELPSESYQIILTTGIGKYPEEFSGYVKETIHEGEKLLKRR